MTTPTPWPRPPAAGDESGVPAGIGPRVSSSDALDEVGGGGGLCLPDAGGLKLENPSMAWRVAVIGRPARLTVGLFHPLG